MRLGLIAVSLLFAVTLWSSPSSSAPITLETNGCDSTQAITVLCDTATSLEWLLSDATTATELFGADDMTDEGFRVPECLELQSLMTAAGIPTGGSCTGSGFGLGRVDTDLTDEGQALISLLTGGAQTSGRLDMHIADVGGTINPPEGYPGGQGTLRFVIFTPPIEIGLRLSFGGVGGSLQNDYSGRWIMVRGASDGEEPVPVPEPGTLALLGIGLAVLGFGRRRKQT